MRPVQSRNRGYRQAMGDVVCLEGDCKVGEALVREMQAVKKQLSGQGKDVLNDSDVEFSRRFGTPVTQIIEAFERENAKFSRHVPFTTVCCVIKDLGVKAQSLTRQMRAFRGVAQTSETPVTSPFNPPGSELGAGINDLLKTALYIGGGFLLLSFLANRR